MLNWDQVQEQYYSLQTGDNRLSTILRISTYTTRLRLHGPYGHSHAFFEYEHNGWRSILNPFDLTSDIPLDEGDTLLGINIPYTIRSTDTDMIVVRNMGEFWERVAIGWSLQLEPSQILRTIRLG